ncbi:uncharacterized protein LOC111430778 isoform X2 [Cucurbita moschata]|uniref:Uncharacterized protein LOC111430778 isoform X2 n=1 Tax=Cucurbita moschata TaxID=3662 RepID=A0A6J1E4T3_CUCMO|nr:uncharacterized protein LOC111430778 isoform X2 [Cucurbita moschata]
MDSARLNLDEVSASEHRGNDFNGIDSESKKDDDSGESVSASSKSGRSKFLKEASQSTMHGLNKFTSQIKKPSHRKVSPIIWFPRKKVDSYLKRKIKMLQEVDGLNLSLDETLGDSNPHYSRVLKEKMAAREAAHKAMEARKAALIETSWCRILRAARIQCKEAEDQMDRAEKTAAEAFKVAAAMGVIMYDTPNCPQKTYKMESSSSGGGGSTTLTITASFETEFEVDKEVAAAVKIALVRLANCSSLREDDFKELLRKISQNPDCDDTHVDPSEPSSSKCESVNDLELDKVARKSDFSSRNFDWKMLDLHMRHKTFEKETKIEDLMYERLRRLKEDELSSLATIVAICGLSAALAEVESVSAGSSAVQSSISALNLPRRMSSAGSSNLHNGRKQLKSELPSLDKFLVKHVTKLEREVLEAKNSRSNEAKELVSSVEDEKVVSNLETMLINPPSALENEVKETECKGAEEFKTLSNKLQARKTFVSHKEVVSAVPSLDKYLVKHVSRFEKEVQEGKENLNMPKSSSKMGWEMEDSLDKILVKPVHRLERENMQAVLAESNYDKQRQNKKQLINNRTSDCQSLDELLVKHVSRLEKEKMRCKPENLKRRESNMHPVINGGGGGGGGLGEILVKHKSRLEREKLMSSHESENQNKSSLSRREAREKDLRSAWGGLSLGDSMRPHLSKLEQDKAAWIKAEEEQRKF